MFAESLGELFKFIEDMKNKEQQPLSSRKGKSSKQKSEDQSEEFLENLEKNAKGKKNGEKLITELKKKMDVVEMNVETIEDRLEMINKDSKDRARLMKEGVNAEIDTMKIFKEKVQLVHPTHYLTPLGAP